MNADDARQIAADWRPRFRDELDFEKSWARYFETATVPDEQRLLGWLAQDLERAEAKYVGIPREPIVPTPSRYLHSDCAHCHGDRYVRVDVPYDDDRFGKALPCPDCNGGRRSALLTTSPDVPSPRSGYWCYKCGADEDQPARPNCADPTWHWPNVNDVRGPLVKRF